MPRTEVVFYQERPGEAPVVEWLKSLRGSDHQAFAKCLAAVQMLSEFGFELRRPLVDYLREGVYELRIKRGRVNYRILYFFHGRNLVVLNHALTKEGQISNADLKRAVERKRLFELQPEAHTFYEGA